MNLVRLALDRPVTTLMLLVSILAVGVMGLVRLPLAYLPKVDVPFIVVSIPRPNSSPLQIQEEVTEPVEEALATLSGINTLRSESTADAAVFFLEFDWGQELDIVRMQVSETVEQVRPTLPLDAQRVSISSFNTADIPVVQARLSAQSEDLSASYPLLEARVLDPIRRIPGVARVDLDGVAPRQVYVDLVHDRIAEHGIEVSDLVERLQSASVEMVLGQVERGQTRYAVRGLGSFDSLEALGSVSVGVADLRLRDLAELSYEEPPIGYGRHLGREQAIGLSVFKESTANTVEVVDAVMRTIEEDIAADPTLEGMELFVWENQADEIRAGVDGLQRAGLMGAAMAILCLYAFLRRLKSTLIVAMCIPFSVLATCGVLYFMGMTLNLLSMMGLMLGVGMLVDNAIVVLEAIDRKQLEEPDARAATLSGAGSVTVAVIAATATSLIVFLPLVLGSKSELTTWLSEVGVTISVALVCSLVCSLTLIPLVASRLLRTGPEQVKGPTKPARVSWLERGYVAILRWTLRRKGWATALLLATLALGAVPMSTGMVASEQFSGTVNERITVRYDFDDFHYKSQAERVVNQVEAVLYEHQEQFEIEEVYSYFAENDAATVITLARADLDDEGIKALRAEIRETLPEVAGVRLGFWGDDQGGDQTRFSLQLYGRDGRVLRDVSAQVEAMLREETDVVDVGGSLEHTRNEIQVRIDRERAQRRGITPQDAAEAFGFTLGGMSLPRYRDGEREVDTWLALRIEDRAGLADLKAITFPVAGENPVRLGDIATFESVPTPQTIVRRNREGNARVGATYEGTQWDAARERIETKMNALDLPLGYAWSWDDRILEQDDQDEQMGINFLLALALVYLVLAALFESLTQPLAILVSIIFALPGAGWLLAIAGTPLNLMAQIGLLILMGIVVNNGAVMLDRVGQLRNAGVERDAAFIEAGRDRLRPILMTASTTVLGLMPLAIGGSAVGGMFYFPLAQTVMGGLISSAVLTLLGLPLVTLGVEALARGLALVARHGAEP
ncbi:MAG: efflux RND transporter permease subunit [Nannocystales bacterium]